MINQIYIDKAIDIQKRFIKIQTLKSEQKEALEIYLNKINEDIPKLEELNSKLENGEYTDKDIFIKEFTEKSHLVEIEVAKIQAIFNELNVTHEDIIKESKSLRDSIMSKYPNLTNEELDKIMYENLKDV